MNIFGTKFNYETRIQNKFMKNEFFEVGSGKLVEN